MVGQAKSGTMDWGFTQCWPVGVMDINCLGRSHFLRQCTTTHRIKKQTNEYKDQIKVFDNHLTDHITARDKKNYITNVPDCNRRSIYKHDPKLDEELNKVVSGNGVP